MLLVAVVEAHGASADSGGSELLLAEGCPHSLVTLLQWDQLPDGSWVLYQQKDQPQPQRICSLRQPVCLTPL